MQPAGSTKAGPAGKRRWHGLRSRYKGSRAFHRGKILFRIRTGRDQTDNQMYVEQNQEGVILLRFRFCSRYAFLGTGKGPLSVRKFPNERRQ